MAYTGMTQWESITCQNQEPHEHRTFEIEVDLSERHGYLNFAPIPERLWLPRFKMEVWDWTVAAEASEPVEGQWCPARCAISETIAEHGIWEPPETLTLLNLFEVARLSGEQWDFIDVGAQLGWFSMLAGQCGLIPICWEADSEVADVLRRNLARFTDRYWIDGTRIGPDAVELMVSTSMNPAIMKIDIEGAEPAAIELYRSSFEGGRIKAALIETTPRFGVDVYAMADQMINKYGMVAHILPHILDHLDASYEPYDQIADLEATTSPERIVEAAEAGNQINVLYRQPDVPTVV